MIENKPITRVCNFCHRHFKIKTETSSQEMWTENNALIHVYNFSHKNLQHGKNKTNRSPIYAILVINIFKI